MWVHQTENKSVNFVAPAGLSADQEVLFPAVDVQTPAYAATIAATIKQNTTFINMSDAMTGNTTLNLTIDAQVTKGAILQVKALSDGTGSRTITFGTGFLAPTMVGAASKTKAMTFIYNGTAFVSLAVAVQID